MQGSNRGLWIGLAVLAVILLASPLLSAGMMGAPGMLGWYGPRPFVGGPWLWGFGLGFGLLRLAFWGVLLVLFVGLFRPWGGRRPEFFDTPRDILDRRYAAGEITREQYQEALQTLGR